MPMELARSAHWREESSTKELATKIYREIKETRKFRGLIIDEVEMREGRASVAGWNIEVFRVKGSAQIRVYPDTLRDVDITHVAVSSDSVAIITYLDKFTSKTKVIVVYRE